MLVINNIRVIRFDVELTPSRPERHRRGRLRNENNIFIDTTTSTAERDRPRTRRPYSLGTNTIIHVRRTVRLHVEDANVKKINKKNSRRSRPQ